MLVLWLSHQIATAQQTQLTPTFQSGGIVQPSITPPTRLEKDKTAFRFRPIDYQRRSSRTKEGTTISSHFTNLI